VIWAELDRDLAVVRTEPCHADALEELQRIVFPTLVDAERFKAAHYRHHVAMFPDGQFCVVDRTHDRAVPRGTPPPHGPGGSVVGMTSTIRLDFDFDHGDHTFADIIAGGWLSSHQPDGRWLYGADIGTHPDYRRRGIARALYAARHDTVRRLGLAGQLTVGMPSGYGAVKGEMSAQAYYDDFVAGRREDPTLSAQRRIGFEPRGLIPGYINDPVCDGYGVVLVLPAERDVPLRAPPRSEVPSS
jgi:GNAT superfamily N-acetyltransferase